MAGWSITLRWLLAISTAFLVARSGAVPLTPRDNSIPSCFEHLREHATRTLPYDLTVVVDQTTVLDNRLRQIVAESVERLLRPGTSVTVVTFSAYLGSRYLDVVVSGRIEQRIVGKRRDYLPKRQLQQSDQCLDEQMTFAHRLVAKALDSAFAASDGRLARSDILAALHDLSRRVGETPAQQRMVLLVSDMLENSSITSFYQRGQLRVINPAAEMKRVAGSGIRADFGGARFVVIGAGLAGSSGSGEPAYRDPRAMLALEEFWRRWLADSNAALVEFGKPTPLTELRWIDATAPER